MRKNLCWAPRTDSSTAALAIAVNGCPTAICQVVNFNAGLVTVNAYTAIHVTTPQQSIAARCRRVKEGSLWPNSAIRIPKAIGSSRVNVLYSILSTGAAETANQARHALATTNNPTAIAAIVRTEALRLDSGHARSNCASNETV